MGKNNDFDSLKVKVNIKVRNQKSFKVDCVKGNIYSNFTNFILFRNLLTYLCLEFMMKLIYV